jgi:hypothetical protein
MVKGSTNTNLFQSDYQIKFSEISRYLGQKCTCIEAYFAKICTRTKMPTSLAGKISKKFMFRGCNPRKK